MTDQSAATDLGTEADRLDTAARNLASLRSEVESREPWPLSPAYGTEPEADWGPKEVLAHTAEMLAYWPREIERIIAGGPEPVPFGRVSTDPDRIGRIGRDRELPATDLFDQIAIEVATLEGRIRSLPASDAARLGLHPRLGQMTVGAMVPRFLTNHLEEHVEQLRSILRR
jgi:hypothetical protein